MSLRFVKTTLFAVSTILAASTAQSTVHASDQLDIQQELSMPGVKLVVIEFYATWCKPCMEAVPKWKALHEKYGPIGLRFIVVSAEGKSLCNKTPDWVPERSICDEDGKIQEQMDAQQLPTSFLYSWQGSLAIKTHEVEPIEKAIDNYFQNTQLTMIVDKVDVIGDKFAISSNPESLRNYIISQITQHSKFDVVSASYNTVPKVSSNVCDRTFPPNSTLRIAVQGNEQGDRRLTLTVEKSGCVKASATESYTGFGLQENINSLEHAASLAVKRILNQLVAEFVKPKNATLAGPAIGPVALQSPVHVNPQESRLTAKEEEFQKMLVDGVTLDRWPYRFSSTQMYKLKYLLDASFGQAELAVAEHMKSRAFTEDEWFDAYEEARKFGINDPKIVEKIAVMKVLKLKYTKEEITSPASELPKLFVRDRSSPIVTAGKCFIGIGLSMMLGAAIMMPIGISHSGMNDPITLSGLIVGTLGITLTLPVGLPVYFYGVKKNADKSSQLKPEIIENAPKYELEKILNNAKLTTPEGSDIQLGFSPYFTHDSGGLMLGGTFN